MPVCITGMHRSGTTLVAQLLQRCGLYLGDSNKFTDANANNGNDYQENRDFENLNDAILIKAGGAWDEPPADNWWRYEEQFDELRVAAERLVREFSLHKYWGWRDPRTSLTLPFWQQLNGLRMPFWTGRGDELRVIVCVRNPAAVAESIRDCQNASPFSGLELWLSYNKSLLRHTLPENRLITHYDNYFEQPEDELRRVLEFIGMKVSDSDIQLSTDVISTQLRHKQSSVSSLLGSDGNREILDLYLLLCDEAKYQPLPQAAQSFHQPRRGDAV